MLNPHTARPTALKDTDSNRYFALQTPRIIHLAGTSAPQVNTSPKANTEDVKRGPVHQVQVEVILQLWGIQHFERYL